MNLSQRGRITGKTNVGISESPTQKEGHDPDTCGFCWSGRVECLQDTLASRLCRSDAGHMWVCGRQGSYAQPSAGLRR
jgi:hypothetical protein